MSASTSAATTALDARSAGDPLRILYVAGWGRSGSTLLTRMLDEVPGAVMVGETRDLWKRGLLEDRLCGCGSRFSACEFWTAVGAAAFGSWDALDPSRLIRLRDLTDRAWSVPFTMAPRVRPGYEAHLDEYVDVLQRLFTAFRTVSGADVVVEASKFPSFALLLGRIPEVDLRVVHLVRDSRGAVFSWEKQVRMDDRPDADAFMERYSAPSAALRYLLYNGQAEILRRYPFLLVRYEDLVRAPRAGLEAVLAHAGHEVADDALDFVGETSVQLGVNHTIAGNPMRLSTGPTRLSLDTAWREAMAPWKRTMVSAVTAPLLRRYGYAGAHAD